MRHQPFVFRLPVPLELVHLVDSITVTDKGAVTVNYLQPRIWRGMLIEDNIKPFHLPQSFVIRHIAVDIADLPGHPTELRPVGNVIDMASSLPEPTCDGCGQVYCAGCAGQGPT